MLCFFSAAFAGGAGKFALTEEERAYLDSIRDREIVIAYSYDLAQVAFNGKQYGMLEPVLDIFRKELGLKVSLTKAGWHEVFGLVDSGRADFYGPIALSEARRQKYITAGPFYRSYSKIVSRVESPVMSMMGLYNRPVGLLENSAMSKTMQTYLGPKNQIVYFPTFKEMIEGLESGSIDAFGMINDADFEVFGHPGIQFEFSVENFYVDQGFISSNKDMLILAGIITRYIEANPGILNEIVNMRKLALLQYSRERFAGEIAHLKKNYSQMLICPSLAFYPLCYVEDGKVKGMFTEIADIFEELTGMKIGFYNSDNYKNIKLDVTEELKNDKCMAIIGAYYDVDIQADSAFLYSPVIWKETMHAYSYRGDIEGNLLGKNIGVTPFSSNYIGWSSVTGNLPTQYNTYDKAMEALKRSEIDAVFIGEMQFDYGYSILKDYSLYEITGLSAEAPMSMLYSAKNHEFNTVFNEAMALFQLLNPKSAEKWKAQSNRYKSDYIRVRYAQQVWMAIAIIGMSLILAVLIYFLARTLRSFFAMRKKNYDLQGKVDCDALTGIYNRRFLENNLKSIIRAQASGGMLGLLFIDVDYFKKYNDTYGHGKGDDCLKAVAKTIESSLLRSSDFVARYGGEEFVVVLPGSDESGILQVANNLLRNIRSLKMPHEKSDVAEFVTISIGGTASRMSSALSDKDYLKRADSALYKSKQSGRNRYTFEALD